MITIRGYIEIEYKDLQKSLYTTFTKSGKNLVTLAGDLGVKSTTSIWNGLTRTTQTVSDSLFTSILKNLDFPVVILYHGGEKKYLIKQTFQKKLV